MIPIPPEAGTGLQATSKDVVIEFENFFRDRERKFPRLKNERLAVGDGDGTHQVLNGARFLEIDIGIAAVLEDAELVAQPEVDGTTPPLFRREWRRNLDFAFVDVAADINIGEDHLLKYSRSKRRCSFEDDARDKIGKGMQATLYYKPKVLQPGEFKAAFERAVAAIVKSDVEITVRFSRRVSKGVDEEITTDAESLRAITDLGKIEFALRVKWQYERIEMWCSVSQGVLEIYAWGEESVQCLTRLALNLGLEETDAPKAAAAQAFEALESRVLALERVTLDVEKALKCFISFRFDDEQTAAPRWTAQSDCSRPCT